MNSESIRKEILKQVKAYYEVTFGSQTYTLGDRIPFARRVLDEKELVMECQHYFRQLHQSVKICK